MNFLKYRNIIGKILFLIICTSAAAQNLRLQRLGTECLLLNNLINDTYKTKLDLASKMLNEGNADGTLFFLMDLDKDSTNLIPLTKLKAKAFILKQNFNYALKELATISNTDNKIGIDVELELLKVLCFTHLQLYDSSKLILKKTLFKLSMDTSGIDEFYVKNTPSKIYNINKIKKIALCFPGCGFVCVNEPQKAFINIAITTVFTVYTAYSISRGYYSTALLSGLTNFMRFYSGGIRGAINIGENKNISNHLQTCILLDNYAINKLIKEY